MNEPASPPSGEPRDPYAPPPADTSPATPSPATPSPAPTAPARTAPARRDAPDGGARRVDPGGLRALAAGALGLMLGALLWPWAALGIVLCLVGAWAGIRVRRQARQGRRRVPAATAAIVVGLAGALVTAGLTAFGYSFHAEISEYQQCVSGANTTTAHQSCEQRLRTQIADRTGVRLP